MVRALLFAAVCVSSVCVAGLVVSADSISERARKLHFSSIVVDTHDDTTQRFLDGKFDLGTRSSTGSIDIPRMREGNLSAIFFSIWMPSKVTGPEAVDRALVQIDAVREQVRKHSNDMVLATTAAEVREVRKQGKIAALMGVEGGHMIGNDIRMVRIFSDLGVRYMTLSHFYNDEWADSSTDKPAHNGLTDFGKDVVREMNRQGIMVDISHVSDKTFFDALEVSKAPLIASHSSCRALCNHPRDMSDDMIKALAAKRGVIQINYERSFVDQAYKEAYDRVAGGVVAATEKITQECSGDEYCVSRKLKDLETQMDASGALPRVSWETIIEHIDHVVKFVGPDYVGLGSDFDGATMPDGMEDCSKLPKITEALMRKGYKDEDIRKILGGNLLRVMEQNEKVSRELQAQ